MSIVKTRNSKNPLSLTYLRRPGQSLDEHIGVLQGHLIVWAVIPVLFFVVFIVEWVNYFSDIMLVIPILFTMLFFLILVCSWMAILQINKQIKKEQLGREGEREVAEHLENLIRLTGCYIYHDIIDTYQNGKKFNIDHVIVSKYGIFVIETKTLSKPAKGETNVEFDGKSVKATNHPRDSEPIEEAQNHLRWLQKHINKKTDEKHFDVKAIVVYPGWNVPKEQMRASPDIWVTSAGYLEFLFTPLTPKRTPNDIKLLNVIIRQLSQVQRKPY